MPTQFSPPFPEPGANPASYADWLAQVKKDLKDPNAYDGLRWNSPEGFTVEPYYTAEQTDAQTNTLVQVAQKLTPGWLNAPAYTAVPGDEKALNTALRHALINGADALELHVPDGALLPRLLDGIKLSDTPVFFRLGTGVDAVQFLQTLRQVVPYQLRGGLLAESGTLPIAVLTNLFSQSTDSPSFCPIGISSHDFHQAGATATQELAFTLARLAETYAHLTEAGLPIDQLVPKTMLSVSVGTSYFVEMAKLRAVRVLLARFSPLFLNHPVLLHCQTSAFYEAAATPYTNLLRATTEAMAAVIGGADVLTVRPYDAVLGTSENHPTEGRPTEGRPNEFSERIARNVSTLLKVESYLDKVADPAAGSYYIEQLTNQLAEAAWALFQQVETMGGFTKAMDTGFIQQAIADAYAAKVEAVREGRILVGVTKFRHDEADAVQSIEAGETTSGPLPIHRLSREFE